MQCIIIYTYTATTVYVTKTPPLKEKTPHYLSAAELILSGPLGASFLCVARGVQHCCVASLPHELGLLVLSVILGSGRDALEHTSAQRYSPLIAPSCGRPLLKNTRRERMGK